MIKKYFKSLVNKCKYIFLNPDFNFGLKFQYIGYRYHFSIGYIIADIDDIFIRDKSSLDNFLSIKDSPHYKFLLGNKDEYKDYYTNNFTDLNINEQLQKFTNLNQNIKSNEIYLIAKIIDDKNKLLIIDGAHRAAISKKRNIKKVKCYI